MQSIGIDIGTTTISLVVLERDSGAVLESRTIPNGTDIDTGREWERVQDANRIVAKAQAELDSLLDAYDDIAAIGLTGQMHGIVYVDDEGTAVSPLYTWKDGRGDQPEADGRSLVEHLREETGLALATGFGLVTHIYHMRHGRVPEGAVILCTIADYLGMHLAGRRVPLLHASNAASLGFYDVVTGMFRKDLLEWQGVDLVMLPPVTPALETLGTYREIPVTVAIGDNQASYIGAAGMKENAVLLNMGTGGQISVLSHVPYEAPGIETRPLTEGRYLLVGASLCGGRAYAILEQFFRSYVAAYEAARENCDRGAISVPPQYTVMERLARAGMEQRDPMHVSTCFQGTRLDPTCRGSIVNIGEDNLTPEGMVYGVLEGMARELYDLYRLIEAGTGIRITTLIGSGNGLRRNPVLQEICEEMFGVQMQLSPYEEEAACGAARCSALTQ